MEKQLINPPELYKHPAFTRVITVKGPCKFIFIAGQTPSDENYKAVAPGDYKAQYLRVIDALTIQLKAAGATWNDVVYRRIYARDVQALQKVLRDPDVNLHGHRVNTMGSTMIGVTELSAPDFLVEIDLMAIVDA